MHAVNLKRWNSLDPKVRAVAEQGLRDGTVLLLPLEPDASARALATGIRALTGSFTVSSVPRESTARA